MADAAWSHQNFLLIYLLTYIFTFLLTKWRNVFIEKLNLYQLVKKITAIYETLRFITSIKSSHHLSLSCFKSNQSMFQFQFQRCFLILKSYLSLDLPNGLFPQDFPPNPLFVSPLLHKCYFDVTIHSSWFNNPKNIW